MLSIEKCRQILGRPDLTDEQIVEIRDTLRAFASLCLDEYLRERREKRPPRSP